MLPLKYAQIYHHQWTLSTANWCLSPTLQGLNHLLPLLTFNTFNAPERSSGWRAKNQHSVLKENWKDSIIQPDIFNHLITRKLLKSLMVMTMFQDQLAKLHETIRKFLKNMCLIACILHQNDVYTNLPPAWNSFSELHVVLYPRLQSPFCPPIKLNSQFHVVHFQSTYMSGPGVTSEKLISIMIDPIMCILFLQKTIKITLGVIL